MSDKDVVSQPGPANSFEHSPLNLQTREVRLLKLVHGSEDNEHVCAVIQHFDLSEAPPFKALSYTWGQAHPLFSIYINGRPFSIRQNLFAFFETVGSDPEYTDAWLWIDQICIQQANTDERNHQVRQMAQIYRSASEVIVWLGPGTAYSEALLQVVANVKVNLTSWSNQATHATVQFLGCEYWTRTWVIQEFILASSIILYWGTTKFGLDDLEMIVRIGGQHIRHRHCQVHSLLQKMNQITELMSQKSKRRHDGYMIGSWKDALMLSSYTICQDVRDHIYALLGLVDPNIAIIPNYAASLQEIFVDVLAGVAVQYSRLHLDAGEEQEFLTTKALISRALGFWNRPLDEINGSFFHRFLSSNRTRAEAANALWAWVGKDNKHLIGLPIGENGSSLSQAVENGREATVRLLLEKPTDLDLKLIKHNGKLLLSAAKNGQKAIVELLLEKGANLEPKEKSSGRSPLWYAAEMGHEGVVKLLLERGADPNSADQFGNTPLSRAKYQGDEAVVKLLLDKAAELEAKNGKVG